MRHFSVRRLIGYGEIQTGYMLPEERQRIIEALIFASDVPLTYSRVRDVIGQITPEEFAADVDELDRFYRESGRAFGIVKAAGGIQLGTKPEYAVWIKRLLADRLRSRLTRPSLETLAIIAYRQPITRGDIERIRGVDCGGVLGTLMERNLVTVGGRATTPGRPLLYVTTQDFLRYFGLNQIEDLPRIRELQGLIAPDPRQEKLALNGEPEENEKSRIAMEKVPSGETETESKANKSEE